MNIPLSQQPPRGTQDWLPPEFKIRKYIFDTWRRVCESYGFEEYLTPIVEDADVYRAKSGEDVGGKELVTFSDLGGRDLCIRPEMTPSVTRMVSRIYHSAQKPLRLFSIANFMRNEKPQRGRNREFWQLNYDIFGSTSVQSDIEIVQIAIEIVCAFHPPKGSFVVNINHRKLIDAALEWSGVPQESRSAVVRTLDKWEKLTTTERSTRFHDIHISDQTQNKLALFMESSSAEILQRNMPGIQNTDAFKELETIQQTLAFLGYDEWIRFTPSIIRGFDYYDGFVFEVFDLHEKNTRSLFGGGRYNGLAGIFGAESFPAVGCAPGDEPLRLFLESWNCIPETLSASTNTFFLPLLSEQLTKKTRYLAQCLRQKNGYAVVLGYEVQKIHKALTQANQRGYQNIILFGEDEAARNIYKLKNMRDGSESEHSFLM